MVLTPFFFSRSTTYTSYIFPVYFLHKSIDPGPAEILDLSLRYIL